MASDNVEVVVLLHGLGRDRTIMRRLEHYLLYKKYQVWNIEYPSLSHNIQTLAHFIEKKINQAQSLCHTPIKQYHFVGHSLGAIIIRYYLSVYALQNLGRVVMIAPPNQGTRLANMAVWLPFYRWWWGPCLDQLRAHPTSFVCQLPDPQYPFGVIAGDRSNNQFYSRCILSGKDDGKVTVNSTKLPTMSDHITVPVAHPYLPLTVDVMEQTAFFLEQGCFFKT